MKPSTIGDYRHFDSVAYSALSVLNSASDKTLWLSQYSQLFDELTYAGDDLPYLADCNFEGQHFEHISEFCKKYEGLLNSI